jgi:uncharacterized protein RhaS with RHS repeats
VTHARLAHARSGDEREHGLQFLSQDPTGWASGQTNNYAYVGGNPISFVDATGLDADAAGIGPRAGVVAEAAFLETG